MVPPEKGVPDSGRDRDQARRDRTDPAARILARLALGDQGPERTPDSAQGERPGWIGPPPNLVGPIPGDVKRIREAVAAWSRSYQEGFVELVFSALLAGRTRADAERLAFDTLAEDAPRWAAESGEAPGPWPIPDAVVIERLLNPHTNEEATP